jgi:hypothetical protein
MANIVGTGMNQPPAQLLNTLNSITQKYIHPEIADNAFTPSPGLQWMTRNGRHFHGGELVYPLATQEELTGGAYYGDQILQTQVIDSIQPANQVWKFYYQSVAIPFTDLVLNAGPEGVIKLAKAKWAVGVASLLMKLSRSMWHLSPQNTAIDIDDLISWLFTTNNVIAGIDRSVGANAFWEPGTKATVANAGALTADDIEQGYQNVTFGYDEPDLCLLPPTMYRAFRKNYISQIRYNQPDQDEVAVQFGFRYHLKYNNLVVFQDRFMSSITSGTGPSTLLGFLINSRYCWPVFHPANYFDVDPFIRPSNQKVLVAQLTLTWQMSNISPRMGCAIDGF